MNWKRNEFDMNVLFLEMLVQFSYIHDYLQNKRYLQEQVHVTFTEFRLDVLYFASFLPYLDMTFLH
ncbi:MAG: hypothetical protein OEL52_07565, partial [Nitrosopumilus sp.]|nr:hypothetical protein [Nitrosopumilus sp.]